MLRAGPARPNPAPAPLCILGAVVSPEDGRGCALALSVMQTEGGEARGVAMGAAA